MVYRVGNRSQSPPATVFVDLPESPQALAEATWSDLAPLYEALATASVTRDSAEEWLREWSRLEELIEQRARNGRVRRYEETVFILDD